MTLDEKLQKYIQSLPRSFQEELLDYVKYLLMKAELQEKKEWGEFSLSSAKRYLEGDSVSYSLADVRVPFG